MDKAPRQTFPSQRVKLAGAPGALTAPIRRIRFAYVALFFCAWTGLIAVRLGWLQVVRHSDFVHRAAMQQQRTFEVAPRRGMMYVRNLRELAVTVQADSVFAVPWELVDNRASAAEILAEIVHADPHDNFTSKQQMLARFNASKNFAWVARRLDAGTAERVRELNLEGVYFQKEVKRFYPNGDLAGHVLGYVGTDYAGLGWLEEKFEEERRGKPGDIVDCQGGALTMYGRTLHDDRSDGHLGLVTVQYALERSSDVGAAKMALKLGNQKFYDYMRAFGFGNRSGIELPSETRGLLRNPKKWGATSILSMAIGQEIGVTPVQLVTMVSTIANGGVYMPPHVLLQSTDQMKGDARLRPAAFRPSNQLPATLPDGAHRVISEMTSAKMRMMMQGIVVEGTGKEAALNGYSSAGKTGTAQKVDVATRTYSHTKLVASFAGFAPVSSPAISVAVVIDTPTVGASKYGGAVSAPVFASVAQQVLEYLGGPHDQPLKTKKEMLVAQKDVVDDAPAESTADLNAMFDDVNSLPADDPLRMPASAAAAMAEANEKPVAATAPKVAEKTEGVLNLLPAKVVAAFQESRGPMTANAGDAAAHLPAP